MLTSEILRNKRCSNEGLSPSLYKHISGMANLFLADEGLLAESSNKSDIHLISDN